VFETTGLVGCCRLKFSPEFAIARACSGANKKMSSKLRKSLLPLQTYAIDRQNTRAYILSLKFSLKSTQVGDCLQKSVFDFHLLFTQKPVKSVSIPNNSYLLVILTIQSRCYKLMSGG
jgi:hypothetical protein